MRILFLGNNWLAWKILEWLRAEGEEIAGLVVHPPEKQKYGEKLVKCAELPAAAVFDGSKLRDPGLIEKIRTQKFDIGLSVLFDYILKPELLSLFPKGVVNLHPAFLPYNRGQYPNVWSIVEGTPSGVTLHYIDEKIDTGDVIAREQVPVLPVDTGESLYRKLERASFRLFKVTWPLIKSGKNKRVRQKRQSGTYHRTRDVEKIDEIRLDRSYLARDLINILRARTFTSYRGAYFVVDGKRVYMRLNLEAEVEREE